MAYWHFFFFHALAADNLFPLFVDPDPLIRDLGVTAAAGLYAFFVCDAIPWLFLKAPFPPTRSAR